VLHETLCFHAQQAAEKAIKAALVFLGVAFPKTHNLGTLLGLLPPTVAVPLEVAACVDLTAYAVLMRYPTESEEVAVDELHAAVAQAQAVLAWAEGFVGASGHNSALGTV
jgi:HEPN domain-containing protein